MMNNYEGAAVAISGLQVVRGRRDVIPRLDLEIPAGEVVGLLGPSGSGKSTLMRCMVGVQIVKGGTVTVLGHPAGSPQLRNEVGYVTQSPSVYADLTVRDNVAYFARAVGLLGPSGSGKSTLMRCMVGVQVVQGGTVTVLGHPAGSPALRRELGYVTQSPSVYADLTVRDNVAYFARAVGLRGAELREAVDRTLVEVDLVSHADVLVADLSGGQESRVSLAAALVGRPTLLVLDEPTVGLDPVLRRDLWELFGSLARQGHSLVVSSHVMDEATRCDRLVLLREGEVLADLTPAELLERTGQVDADAAFLALIDAETTGRRRAS